MEFDVTNIDRILLLKAAFAYSNPIGFGKIQYNIRKSENENVDGLTDEECKIILLEFENMKSGFKRVLDYHKGKPMKLDFVKKDNGQILISTLGYDSRNGKYRFLELMLDIFLEEEIIITKKGYGDYIFSSESGVIKRSKEQNKVFKNLLKSLILEKNDNGKFWKINPELNQYKSPIDKLIG